MITTTTTPPDDAAKDRAAPAAERDEPRPRSGGRYGRCGGCGGLKSLDGRGHPYPHNRYTYQLGSRWLSARRCPGERLEALPA